MVAVMSEKILATSKSNRLHCGQVQIKMSAMHQRKKRKKSHEGPRTTQFVQPKWLCLSTIINKPVWFLIPQHTAILASMTSVHRWSFEKENLLAASEAGC